jgi:Tfp pilus assembly protein PilV
MARRMRTARGISLIEAVVALAVMAFGMLAYVGLQSTLRFNSDVAKQRSEAVRIAQEAIEQWRAYSAIETTAGRRAYDDLPAGNLAPVVIAGENASFTLQRTVVDSSVSDQALLRGAAPRMKALTVDVSWQDRNGDNQSVRLSTTLTASPPELAGALAVPGRAGPQQLPQGRNAAIPVLAKDLGGGISGYKPPGAAGGEVVFVFNNATGVIVGVCNGVQTDQEALTAAEVQNCSNNANALPLSGFVRFSTGLAQPTAADSERPSSTAHNLELRLDLTSDGHPDPSHACYADAPGSALTTRTVVPYFCVVFFQPDAVPLWSGISTLTPLAFVESPDHPWRIADDADDVRVTRYRVCRYTPAANDAQAVANTFHPRTYQNVSLLQPLTNQNFLVIRAGDGSAAFGCPTDVPADPAAGDFVNSNTLVHQPAPGAP